MPKGWRRKNTTGSLIDEKITLIFCMTLRAIFIQLANHSQERIVFLELIEKA